MCLITDSKKKKINCIYFSNMNKKFGEKWKLLIEISWNILGMIILGT